MDNILEVNNLTYSYNNNKTIFNNLQFSIKKEKMGVTARDLAYVFLRMKQQYSCNLNPVVAALTTYSVNDISQAFQRELSSNE